ncbi:glycosyltransferase [Guyparkeria halopsychrophila]|uniref:glycosyltransferase family 4 protein n=1 Tax=Guyparkeria halopsychrophila TaxID=3139421 RepID=UPI0037CC9559
MRIGIDASNLLGGGGLTHLRQLIKAADPERHGFSELLVWGGDRTLSALEDGREGVKLIHEPQLDRGLISRFLWRTLRLPRLAQKSCDLLLIPGGLGGPKHVPWVTMSRNMLPFEKREKARYPPGISRARLEALRWLQSRAFKKADGVIFLTNYARAQITAQLQEVPSKNVVIPHGIDSRFLNAPSIRWNSARVRSREIVRILYVSTVNAYKHQWHVAEAISQIRDEGWPVELRLVGGGYEPALSKLKRVIVKLDPDQNWLVYCGSVAHEKLDQEYKEADIFVFASSCENMPNILLEAMAGGLPIASSDRGPMPEILADGGQYFDPEQPAMIADAIRNLLDDPERRYCLAAKAYRRSKEYSWLRCADETFAFLRKTYEEASGASPH